MLIIDADAAMLISRRCFRFMLPRRRRHVVADVASSGRIIIHGHFFFQ